MRGVPMRGHDPRVVSRPAQRETRKNGRLVASLVAVLGVVVGPLLAVSSTAAGASSPADQGVTAKTINVGVPVRELCRLEEPRGRRSTTAAFLTRTTPSSPTSTPTAGINGRKIVLCLVEMNPSCPRPTTSSCTQLTEDDKVFVAISPVFPDCYQQTHDTPVIAGVAAGPVTGERGARLRPHPARREL